jgi:hypothetical protein
MAPESTMSEDPEALVASLRAASSGTQGLKHRHQMHPPSEALPCIDAIGGWQHVDSSHLHLSGPVPYRDGVTLR